MPVMSFALEIKLAISMRSSSGDPRMGEGSRIRGDPLFHGKLESKCASRRCPDGGDWRVPSEADRAWLVVRGLVPGRRIVAALVWVKWLFASEFGELVSGVSRSAVSPIALMSSCGSSDDPVNIQRSLTRE